MAASPVNSPSGSDGNGRLDVRDIAPLQVALTRQKLEGLPQVHVACRNAVDPEPREFDAVTCFFLLHEVPDDVKVQIVQAMLQLVGPGGKAIFIDYHRPHRWHPLKPVMQRVFAWLEPFALTMWSREIENSRRDERRSFPLEQAHAFRRALSDGDRGACLISDASAGRPEQHWPGGLFAGSSSPSRESDAIGLVRHPAKAKKRSQKGFLGIDAPQ